MSGTDTSRHVQVPAKDAALRKALDAGEEFVLFDGDEPVARVIPVAAEVKRSANRLKFYPHDPDECLHTCWRHQRRTATAAPAAADTPEPAKTETAIA